MKAMLVKIKCFLGFHKHETRLIRNSTATWDLRCRECGQRSVNAEHLNILLHFNAVSPRLETPHTSYWEPYE
jgi:hypothetical protein